MDIIEFRNEIKKNFLLFCSKEKGLTLIELLVALALFSVVLAIIWAVFDPFQRGYTEQQVTMDVVQKARGSVSFIIEDIKLAGLDPTESGNFQIQTATATDFTYDFDAPDADNKFDGELDLTLGSDKPERRTYSLDGGTLYQYENLATPAVADYPAKNEPEWERLISGIDMASSRFEYLDEDGNILNPVVIADIRAVRVTLAVSQPSGRGGSVSRTMTAMALCRNLHFNAQR